MNTLRGLGSRAAGTLGRRDTRLNDPGSDRADGKWLRSYSGCCPTGLDFFPRNHGLWPCALTANREDHMWGLRVPVCDEEHCGMAQERLRSILMPQEGRRNSSRAPSLCDDRIDPAVALSRIRAMRPCSPTYKPSARMKIWRVRPKKCLRSKFVGAVLWPRFISVNAHVRGLG